MYFLANLHKNSILTGSLDCYCLVCDNYLRSEDEAFLHTEKPIHRKNIDAAILLDKYKDDQIIKVKKGYYCTFCNILLSTTTKVGLHISDIRHQETRRVLMVRRVSNNVVAFDNVAIAWESWHGIMDNTCVICNTEFEKDDVHWKDQSHILNLIQSKYEFGDKYVYRKADEDTFFCLICSNVYSINDKPTHHESSQHDVHYNAGKELKIKTRISNEHITKANDAKIAPIQNTVKVKFEDVSKNSADSEKPLTIVNINKVETTAVKITNKVIHGQSERVTQINSIDAKFNNTESTKKTDAVSPKMTPTEIKVDISIKDTSSNKQNQHSTKTALWALQNLLSDTEFFVQDEDQVLKCVLCDFVCKNEADADDHLNTPNHKAMRLKLRETLNKKNPIKKPNVETHAPEVAKVAQPEKVISSPKKIKEQNSSIKKDNEEENSKLLDNLDKFQAHGLTIDFTYRSARCKKCKNSLELNYSKLQQHIQECLKDKNNLASCKDKKNPASYKDKNILANSVEKNIKPKKDTTDKNKIKESKEKNTKSKTEAQVKEKNDSANSKQKETTLKIDSLMSQNYMVTVKNEPYCSLCSITISRNMKDLSAHVNSNMHKTKVQIYQTQPIKKVLMSDLIQQFSRIETSLGSDIILNNSIVLGHYSFHCVKVDVRGYTCDLCKITFNWIRDNLTQHLNSDEHKKKIADCYVVISMDEEFIREVSTDVYHCGFCNEIFNKWNTLEAHLTTRWHSEARCHAEWSMQRWQAVVRNSKAVQVSSIHALNFT